MALTREKKESLVAEVTDILRSSPSLVFANFHGVSVADANELRQAFRDRGVGYKVIKKTLLKRVLDEQEIAGERPSLDGEVAIAYPARDDTDTVQPAQMVSEFQKRFEERISPIGGIFEGRFIAKTEVERLASIPSRQVLYGQFATVINAPVQQSVQVLSGVARSFVVALDQIKQQKA